MRQALIVEDEPLAANRLARLLAAQTQVPVTVVAQLASVQEAVAYFKEQPAPDLAFFDVQLADGLSFEVFDQVAVSCPIIFTTAFDAYALRAFKANSIDYLLKPIDEEELAQALRKLQHLTTGTLAAAEPSQLQLLQQALQQLQNPSARAYKNRFVLKVGEHLRAIPVEEIDFFYSFEKATFLQTADNRRFALDYTMEQLEQLVDPQRFFRVNRGYLVQLNAIQDIVQYSNSRLKVVLRHHAQEEVLVSRERVGAFRAWLDQ
ncbi:LytR/AlgR family response regulator transcription factor [Rufibacter glacialis]|uniref:Response regulator transcription factor n=1 Tax=Rufibacter glacialis TaxID=1259555 RepID=A0A5M8QBB6_9BACT|nr:LytTR family DNA-binding domain-containing protein [Rufibacter glacialis]KAA6433287.1 response regulator transcription factor [Rufibacter glacialis]GGK75789.1 DNA-binding response regulator [Rufibacter glacialis]